jgi:broad specificity phosphatase PhoE
LTHRLFLLRHGASTGNERRIRQGRIDFPLSEAGKRQIELLAEHWNSVNRTFDEIISSPLARARTSADIIARVLAAPVTENPLWQERDAGIAQGKPLRDSEAWTDDHKPLHAYEPLFDEGESLIDLHVRAASAIQSLITKPPGTYLVVAHGGILGAAVRVAMGLMPTAWNAPVHIRFDNASFSELTFDNSHQRWSLVHVNASASPINVSSGIP